MKESRFYRVIEFIFVMMVMVILLIDVVIDNRFTYVYKNNCPVPNLLFVFLFILFIGVYIILKKKNKSKEDSHAIDASLDFGYVKKVFGILSLLLFITQIFYSKAIYFETGWDCKTILSMASELAFDNNKIGNTHYFSIYPNNVFLTGFFAGILKLEECLGINTSFYSLTIVGSLLVSMAGFFMVDCVRILTGKKSLMYVSWVFFVLLTGLSPWISIPYSDTFSIFFPTFAIWIFLKKNEKNNALSWFFITVTCFVGSFIKPTVLLTFMVLLFFDVFHFICNLKKEGLSALIKRVAFSAVSILTACIFSILLRNGMEKITGFTPDEYKQFTPMHYLMLGANYEYGGGYNQFDANVSLAYLDLNVRNKRDFEEALTRYKEMLPFNIISFEAKKCLTNFNDGTFAWGKEGDFYWTFYDTNNRLALLLRNLIYDEGEYHGVYVSFAQSLWILVLCSCTLLIIKKGEKHEYKQNAVVTCVIAIICFLTLFEARGRYLYLYSPVIYMVASMGINRLISSKR